MVKNSSANAGDMGSVPGLGRSLTPGNKEHAPQPVKLVRSTARVPQLAVTTMRRPCTTPKEQQPPLTTTRESPPSTKKTQHSQKILNEFENGKKIGLSCTLNSSSTCA